MNQLSNISETSLFVPKNTLDSRLTLRLNQYSLGFVPDAFNRFATTLYNAPVGRAFQIGIAAKRDAAARETGQIEDAPSFPKNTRHPSWYY